MKYKTQVANTHISNDLHDQLLSKDCASFWKTWKTKVNERLTAANDVDGCTNATDIANSFANLFQQACLPNSSDYSEKLKNRFEEKFRRYQPDSKLQWISVETVDKCIGGMKLQRAAGVDGIKTEHLRYAHPRICVTLALLFNAMLIHGVVLSMFGMGITVPLIKCHNMYSSSSDNYRGITLSVHISKVFEM